MGINKSVNNNLITTDRWGRARAPEDMKRIRRVVTLVGVAAMAIIVMSVAVNVWAASLAHNPGFAVFWAVCSISMLVVLPSCVIFTALASVIFGAAVPKNAFTKYSLSHDPQGDCEMRERDMSSKQIIQE